MKLVEDKVRDGIWNQVWIEVSYNLDGRVWDDGAMFLQHVRDRVRDKVRGIVCSEIG